MKNIIVYGSRFGQFYLEALKRMKGIKIVGLLAKGSDRSYECARYYNIPLYTSLDEVEERVDVACVAVKTGALAVKLLEKGIEVNNLFVIDSYPVSGKVEDEFIDEVIFLPNYQLMLSEVLEDVDDFKVMEFITEVRKRNNGNIPQNTFFNIIEKDSKMKNNSGLWEFVNSTNQRVK